MKCLIWKDKCQILPILLHAWNLKKDVKKVEGRQLIRREEDSQRSWSTEVANWDMNIMEIVIEPP